MSEYVKKRLFHGFICMHILHHAQKEPVYGRWMVTELAYHGYQLSYGTLYPVLHGLEREGLLRCFTATVEGKYRKYYSLTPKGEETLNMMRNYLSELTAEITETEHER